MSCLKQKPKKIKSLATNPQGRASHGEQRLILTKFDLGFVYVCRGEKRTRRAFEFVSLQKQASQLKYREISTGLPTKARKLGGTTLYRTNTK